MTVVFDHQPVYVLDQDTLHRDPRPDCPVALSAQDVDAATAVALLSTPGVQPCPICIGIPEED